VTITTRAAFLASPLPCFRLVHQPEAGQCHARETDAEFSQRRTARDGLGEALGEFIELLFHAFPFIL